MRIAVIVVMIVRSMVVRVVVGMARAPSGHVGMVVSAARVRVGMVVAVTVPVLVGTGVGRG